MIRVKIRGRIFLDYNNTIEISTEEAVELNAQDLVNELLRADIAATAGVSFDLSQVQVTFERITQ